MTLGVLEPAMEPTGLVLAAAPTLALAMKVETALDQALRCSSASQNTATVRISQDGARKITL